jgi:hypothetical protein
VSRKRRAQVLEAVRRVYPDATDAGAALEMRVGDGDFRDAWLFMLGRDFSGIRAGGRAPNP